jgi:hypothetical protein
VHAHKGAFISRSPFSDHPPTPLPDRSYGMRCPGKETSASHGGCRSTHRVTSHRAWPRTARRGKQGQALRCDILRPLLASGSYNVLHDLDFTGALRGCQGTLKCYFPCWGAVLGLLVAGCSSGERGWLGLGAPAEDRVRVGDIEEDRTAIA